MDKTLVVAFDMDDTLIIPAVATGFDRDVPNYEVIGVYRWFQAQGHFMVIWSGGGADYAYQWAQKLGLHADKYLDKHDVENARPDLAFDDSSYLNLATVNVHVRRVNNKVVRHPERIEHAETIRTYQEITTMIGFPAKAQKHSSFDCAVPADGGGFGCENCLPESEMCPNCVTPWKCNGPHMIV